ncbi:MAG: C4-dicarboxylate ABC transporter permease [Firmicutes bacterium HGW-Firmicutes-12]|jgi:C4-dicarboxylate transporter DctM subunit|nr:MAG: C4-dicarboxylate ABC transporter permease [Firmicutes bacterium HGW-Firmicutes-12]
MDIIMFLIFIGLLLIEVPVAIAIGIAGVFGMWVGNLNMQLAATAVVYTLNSFTLIAVPFFILAGNIMSRGSIASKLLKIAQVFLGERQESIAIATLIACGFFAALSGSAVATVAALGAITIPMMISQGYKPGYAGAIAASGAIVGPIIPPSIIMVVYGVQTNTSISDLFIAGVIPGILLITAFIITFQLTKKNNIKFLPLNSDVRKYSIKDKLWAIWDGKWALLMPIIVLGGIYSGLTTPTEASVIAVDYTIIVSLFIERDMKWRDLAESFKSTILTLGGLLILLGTAATFGYVITLNQIPENLCSAVLGLTSNPIVILFLVNIVILIAGCFMEAIAAIVIFAPILLPLVNAAGVSNLAFGIIMCVNLVIGTLTPPFGLNLFVASSVSGVSVQDIIKKAVPYMVAAVIVLLLITYIPQLTEFLPEYINGF